MRALCTAAVIGGAAACLTLGCGNTPKDQLDNGAAGKESSITGCLQRGDDGGSFVLHADNEPTPQGNERDNRQMSAARTYRVVADQNQDISGNVGARVKLTGYVETVPVHASGDRNGSAQPAGTSGVNTKPQDQRSDLIDMKVFKTTAIEKIGDCR
jgi:hypothetical protein